MSAAAQLRVGESVMRKLANCTGVFAGGAIPGVLSNLPVEAILADARAQTREITVRFLSVDVSGLGHCVEEGAHVEIQTDLPQAGCYRVANDPIPLPNIGQHVLTLRTVK